MKIEQSILIQQLHELTQQARKDVTLLKSKSAEELNAKSNPTSWSVLECIEHLNLYGKFYLPEIENRITQSKTTPRQIFKSGWLGNYFNKMIKVSNTKKMKAVKDMDTTGSNLNPAVLDQFLKQLDWLDILLHKAEQVDLTRVKTSISLSPFVKLRLGDTLQFLVYHNQRHIAQAIRATKVPSTRHPLTSQ